MLNYKDIKIFFPAGIIGCMTPLTIWQFHIGFTFNGLGFLVSILVSVAWFMDILASSEAIEF